MNQRKGTIQPTKEEKPLLFFCPGRSACWILQGKGCLCVGLLDGSLCPSPTKALHLLISICISHLGPVPLGKFPAPVHFSLQSWTSCFCQLLRGASMTCYEQQQGEKDSISFCQPLPKKASCNLPFNTPKVDMERDSVPREKWGYQ